MDCEPLDPLVPSKGSSLARQGKAKIPLYYVDEGRRSATQPASPNSGKMKLFAAHRANLPCEWNLCKKQQYGVTHLLVQTHETSPPSPLVLQHLLILRCLRGEDDSDTLFCGRFQERSTKLEALRLDFSTPAEILKHGSCHCRAGKLRLVEHEL